MEKRVDGDSMRRRSGEDRIDIGKSSTVVMFHTEILPRHVIAQKIPPAARDLRSPRKDFGIVNEGKNAKAKLIGKAGEGILF
jgi:hypothetical protein